MNMIKSVRVVMPFLAMAVMGCVADDVVKYVGTWGVRSAKAKDSFMVKLDEGGGGYAMSPVGAAPLKWKETDTNRLDIRFSCGDGFLSFYDLAYSPEDQTLRLLHKKSVCLRNGAVSDERTYKDMVLSRSNEYARAMVPLIEYTEKVRKFHAQSNRIRRQKPPEIITNCMVFTSWDDVSQLGKTLQDGWSVSLSDDKNRLPSVSVHYDSGREQGRIGLSIYGGQFAIGNPEDTCDFEFTGRYGVSLPVESVPSNAVPLLGMTWDTASESDTLRRIRDKGWMVNRTVFYTEHFFYVIFRTSYDVQTGDTPADEVLNSLHECFGNALRPPLKVIQWKIKK